MADQRPFGRFRLPWVTAAPRPAAEPQPPRPTTEIQAPPQPTTTIPQRPFRPGLASVQSPPPPQIRVPQRTEPQPFPTTATIQTGAASVPTSPSKTSSPSRPASQIARTSQPSPPSRKADQLQQEEPKPGRSLLFSQATQPTAEFKSPSEQVEKEKTKREGKESKASGRTEEEPLRSAITELLSGSRVGSQRRELHSVAIQSEKEEKKTATTGSQREQIKTAPKAKAKSTESQQKSTTANGEHVPLHKEIKEDISKLIHKLGAGKLKHPVDDKPVSVVTIAGQNTGASMHVGAEPVSKDGSIHIHRGYKLNPDDSAGTTTDGEGSSKGKRAKNKTKEDQVTKAYVNSNTQSVNNSIIFDSSVNEKSPGVHLDLCQNLEEQNPSSDKAEPLETHKAEFSATPAQKLTYEPSIRRRCLRGLFLEPSDTDDDNPEKPRRHGCRYACKEKSSDKDAGLF